MTPIAKFSGLLLVLTIENDVALMRRNAHALLLALTLTSCSFPGPLILLLCFVFLIIKRDTVNLPVLRMYVKKFCSLGTTATVRSASVLSHGVKAGR